MQAKTNAIEYLSTPSNPTSKPNPYICPSCSKAFPSAHALRGHQQIHPKERVAPYHISYIEECLARVWRTEVTLPSTTPLQILALNEGYGQNVGDHSSEEAKLVSSNRLAPWLKLNERGDNSHGHLNYHPELEPALKKLITSSHERNGASSEESTSARPSNEDKEDLDLTLRL